MPQSKVPFCNESRDNKSNACRKLPAEKTPAEILRLPKGMRLGLVTKLERSEKKFDGGKFPCNPCVLRLVDTPHSSKAALGIVY